MNSWARYGRASFYCNLQRYREAIADWSTCIELDPKNAIVLNLLARLLATCPDPKFRDCTKAVMLAKKAVELAPTRGPYWNTLGAAHYRAGNWKEAVEALEKSCALQDNPKGGDARQWFVLAMAHGKLAEKVKARELYDRAVRWMDKYQPQNVELHRFRAEAAELLGIEKKKD
jgi:tetratricopeptide (TPR) repeat protein